jgi:hypothetical protein
MELDEYLHWKEEKPMGVSDTVARQRVIGVTDSFDGEKPCSHVCLGERMARGQIPERQERCRRGQHSEGSSVEEVLGFVRFRGRNSANPMIGSGVQQTRKIRDGVNRQGGGKPRRRNVTCPWQRRAETSPSGNRGNRGSERREFRPMEGRSLESPSKAPGANQEQKL